MKRHGSLFEQIIDMDNLREAYRRACRGKSRKSAVVRFARNPEPRLEQIQQSLLDETFRTAGYDTKWVHEPKARLIYVLPFSPDRIVQHAIMNIVEPIWNAMFISDSYSCRKGKGLHAGSRRVMGFVRQYKYCLKCDIYKFYPSIHHDTLY